ncbi:hypothetical protein BAMBUS_00030 [Brevundimonas phage vB_BpoS-Bambus]|nr:hypothetical protein BAMBUS_00030 [Brevundimonas phage vB_BpoS-Bambus]
MTLDQVKRDAQRTANRGGAPVAVLNLNTVGRALYVIRAFEPGMESEGRTFCGRFDPDPDYQPDEG